MLACPGLIAQSLKRCFWSWLSHIEGRAAPTRVWLLKRLEVKASLHGKHQAIGSEHRKHMHASVGQQQCSLPGKKLKVSPAASLSSLLRALLSASLPRGLSPTTKALSSASLGMRSGWSRRSNTCRAEGRVRFEAPAPVAARR